MLTEEEQDRHYQMFGVRQPYLPPGVRIRRARLDDREAILDMSRTSDIFEGHDYLSIRYQEYIDDPDRYLYLAEKDGQVVTYMDQYCPTKANSSNCSLEQYAADAFCLCRARYVT